MLAQGFGQDQTLANVAPQNGQYSYSWAPDAGTYTIYAEWSGDDNYQPATSQQLQVTVNKMPVTLQVDPIAKVELDPLFQSSVNVNVNGQITPPLQGTHITVALGQSGQSISASQPTQYIFNPYTQSLGTQFDTVTDTNGRFTTQIPIDKPGAWQAVVAWDGDTNHLGFSQSVSIEAEWNYTPYIIVGVIGAATLLGAGSFLVRRRSAGKQRGKPTQTQPEQVSRSTSPLPVAKGRSLPSLAGHGLNWAGEGFGVRAVARDNMQTHAIPDLARQGAPIVPVNQVQLGSIRSNIHIAWIFELLSIVISIIGSIGIFVVAGLFGPFLGGLFFLVFLAEGGWYLIPLFVVSLVVFLRITRMRAAANVGDLSELVRLNTTAWGVLALIFGGVIPGIMLLMAHSSATNLIAQLSETSASKVQVAPTGELDALARLKGLLDSNAITREEFDQLKGRVLSGTRWGEGILEERLSKSKALHDSGALTDADTSSKGGGF
jgi:hypothetical protein